jgi:chromosomal replication initiation ATPase DnaA
MSIFQKIIDEIKVDDNKVDEYIKQYEQNIKSERWYFLKKTTPENFWKASITLIDKRIIEFIKNNKIFCWIYGSFGTGKTYSLYAIRNYFIMQKGKIYTNIFQEDILNYDIKIRDIDMIDNFGMTENKLKYLTEFYFTLFDFCWRERKKLYIVSNKHYREWLEMLNKNNAEFSGSIASRFSNNIDCIELQGKDKRKLLQSI